MEIISKDFCLTNLIEPYKEIYTIPFLTESFCESVINEAKQIGFKKNSKETKAKQILECNFNATKMSYAAFLLEDLVGKYMNNIFWELWRRNINSGQVQVANYNPNKVTRGSWHHDHSADITMVVPLNTGEYDGGGTEFWKKGIVKPLPIGTALFFPSFHNLHRGLPVTSGDRYLLVFWLNYLTNQFN